MKFLSDEEARRLICDIGRRMSERGFVSANDGNMTIRVGEDTVWATPTGTNKGELTPDMLLKLDFNGMILENPGNMQPTSETKLHLNVYKMNPEIQSTCHTHAQNAMIWACCGIALDVAYGPEPVGTIGKVPVAPYGCPGSQALSESIKPFCKDYKCCLMANHGAISWGRSPKEAWYIMEALEAYARLCVQIRLLDLQPRLLSKEQIEEVVELCRPSGMSEQNRLRGADEITNRQPGMNLSEILGI